MSKNYCSVFFLRDGMTPPSSLLHVSSFLEEQQEDYIKNWMILRTRRRRKKLLSKIRWRDNQTDRQTDRLVWDFSSSKATYLTTFTHIRRYVGLSVRTSDRRSDRLLRPAAAVAGKSSPRRFLPPKTCLSSWDRRLLSS